ncbi:hypothetical protein K8Q98_00485, partial [Candidatus Nomurabacteria bacterium]|nr:hypothetical protein [Candidatus Nomurabacteria bacterium]
MKNNFISKLKKTLSSSHFRFATLFIISILILVFAIPEIISGRVSYRKGDEVANVVEVPKIVIPVLDVVAYEKKINDIANNPIPPVVPPKFDPVTGAQIIEEPEPVVKPTLWPPQTVYPNAGALLPFNRIIAYYGNLYSKKMGVLGEYEESIMLAKLDEEVKKWEMADPNTPVMPALHYIAVVAQASAGEDGKYRARMPDSEIDKVLAIAAKINAIVFLDIQVGFSTIQDELPRLEKYLKLPNVHLGMDPEFSMKHGIRPGKVVGTYDAV